MLSRAMTLVATAVFVAAIAMAAWQVMHPAMTIFIAPSATNIRVENSGLAEQDVYYQILPGGWQNSIAAKLTAIGWRRVERGNPAVQPETYSRTTSFWFIDLYDVARFSLYPSAGSDRYWVRVSVQRRIISRW